MDDDFEIEVTDLHTGATTNHPLANNMPPEPDHDGNDEPAPQPGKRRRQRQRAAIVASIVVLAVVLVIFINPAAKASLYTMFRFPTPVPSPTPLPGANMVYLVRGAPWANVILDGKQSDIPHVGLWMAWAKLSPGRHTIVVTQPPFRTLLCSVSMPAAKSDTCPLISPLSDQYAQYDAVPDIPSGSRFVDLGARFSLLPQHDQDTLVAAATADLEQRGTPMTLHPGDHYLRDDGRVAVAQTTLQATFIPTLLTPVDTVPSDSQSCVSFCDRSGIGMSTRGTWDIMVSLLGSWHVATPDGKVLANHAPMFPSDPTYQQLAPSTQVMLSILWTGQWQISDQNEFGGEWSSSCQAAQQMLTAVSKANQIVIMGQGAQKGQTPEQGCVISLMPSDPTQSDPIYVYYHLGVLLAANDAAHRAFPALPAASAAERALSRQILTQS